MMTEKRQLLVLLRVLILVALQDTSAGTPLYDSLRQSLTRIEDTLNLPHTYQTRQERRRAA